MSRLRPPLQVPHHAPLPLLHLPNPVHLRPALRRLQQPRHLLHLPLAHDDSHPNPTVERPRHLLRRDVPQSHQPLEHGEELEPLDIDPAPEALRQDPRHVLREPSASDVRQPLDEAAADGGEELLDVDGRRRQELLSEGLGRVPRDGGGEGEVVGVDDLADEGEAVRVDAGGGEAEDDVAGGDGRGGEDELALDGSDGEAGDVVVV